MKGTVEARGAYQSSWKNSGQRDEKKKKKDCDHTEDHGTNLSRRKN